MSPVERWLLNSVAQGTVSERAAALRLDDAPPVHSPDHMSFVRFARQSPGSTATLIPPAQRLRGVAYTSIQETLEHPAVPCPPPGMRST